MNKNYIWVFMLLLISISCNNANPKQNTPFVDVPLTKFAFQPVENLQVNESDSVLFLRVPGDKESPLILIWGKTFVDHSSRTDWINEVSGEKYFEEINVVEFDDFSGRLSKFEDTDFFSLRASLTTEQEGMVLMVTSHPNQRKTTEYMFDSILNSIVLK